MLVNMVIEIPRLPSRTIHRAAVLRSDWSMIGHVPQYWLLIGWNSPNALKNNYATKLEDSQLLAGQYKVQTHLNSILEDNKELQPLLQPPALDVAFKITFKSFLQLWHFSSYRSRKLFNKCCWNFEKEIKVVSPWVLILFLWKFLLF